MNKGGTETPGEERKLNPVETISEARRLLGAFKDALRVVPELSSALMDGYLSEEPNDRINLGHESIKFTRGSFRYTIDYGAMRDYTGRLNQELLIIREPSEEKGPGDLTELMRLFVESDSADISFKRGKRDNDKFWDEEGLEFSNSNSNATRRIEALLEDLKQAS